VCTDQIGGRERIGGRKNVQWNAQRSRVMNDPRGKRAEREKEEEESEKSREEKSREEKSRETNSNE
jgi:hypothetical protein